MKKVLSSLLIIISIFCLSGCINKERLDIEKPSSYKLLEDGTYAAEYDVGSRYCDGICLKIPNKYEGKKVTQLANINGFREGILKIKISKNISHINLDELYDLENLREIVVSKQNKNYSSLDGILYTKQRTELIYSPRAISGNIRFPLVLTKIGTKAFFKSRSLMSIEIPENVTEIGDYAFYKCDNLQWLSFHENCEIAEIGEYAFSNCRILQNFSFPKNCVITKINKRTFEGCDGIWYLTLPKSIKIIDEYAFYDCYALKTIDFYDNSQLEEILAYAFGHCTSLEKISISNTLKFIGDGAFYDCRNLKEIHYNGTAEQWERIVIEEDNEYLNSANLNFNQ